MLLMILSKGILSRYHVQDDALPKSCYYCDPVVSQSNSTTSLTDRCSVFFLSFLMKFFCLVQFLLLNHQDCFLFRCEWYEMKQCLVPCLLSSNFSQQAMTICLLLIEFRFDAYLSMIMIEMGCSKI